MHGVIGGDSPSTPSALTALHFTLAAGDFNTTAAGESPVLKEESIAAAAALAKLPIWLVMLNAIFRIAIEFKFQTIL